MKLSVSAVLAAATVALAAPAPAPAPTPPGIPDTDAAKSALNDLTIATPGSKDGYARSKFPTWITISGKCNTREYVLKRDGQGVKTNDDCVAESGNWVSPYDGSTTTVARDLDIDHMVPLENVWISGGASWTTDQRKTLANDVNHPQLWAVSLHMNRSKGDKSPDQWKPPLTSFHCTYAKAWVSVKSFYNLTATDAEKSALSDMLDTC